MQLINNKKFKRHPILASHWLKEETWVCKAHQQSPNEQNEKEKKRDKWERQLTHTTEHPSLLWLSPRSPALRCTTTTSPRTYLLLPRRQRHLILPLSLVHATPVCGAYHRRLTPTTTLVAAGDFFFGDLDQPPQSLPSSCTPSYL